MATDDRPPPLSRQAGRAAGRWWQRHGDQVRTTSRPVRKGWATLMGYAWLVAYVWVGLMLAVGLRNITGADGIITLLVGVGGGCVIGWWQAGHRVARHADPATPPLRRFGLALAVWMALIALAVYLDLRI